MNTPNQSEVRRSEISFNDQDSFLGEHLLRYANLNDAKGFESHLAELKDYEILKVADKKSYTLLHICCLNNNEDIFDSLLNYIASQNEEKKDYRTEISAFVDQKTSEGYAAIHFASYKGNLKFLTKLESLGADLAVTNNFGLNVMHIAAQGDSPLSLYFFKKRGFNINQKDSKGSSPLHWATFRGCENAVNYLTAWGCEINKPDMEGSYTPLHLAVISSNSKIVRRLLLKGADRNVTDKNFKKPIDLAKDNDYHNIYNMLDKKGSYLELCDIKSTKKTRKRRLAGVLMFFVIILIFNIADIFLYFPYVNHLGEIIIETLLFFLSLVFFCLAWLKDPGSLKMNTVLITKTNFIDLLNTYEPSSLCPECEILKPVRSRHCEICETCIQVYDHHCPWINNCVGARNHRFFLGFIICIMLNLIYEIVLIGLNIGTRKTIYLFMEVYDISDYNFYWIKILISVFLIIASLFFLIPLMYLVYIHCFNFALNKTTSERFGYNARKETSHAIENSRKTSSESNINAEFSQKLPLLKNVYQREGSNLPSKKEEETNDYAVINNCVSMCIGNQQKSIYIYGTLVEKNN